MTKLLLFTLRHYDMVTRNEVELDTELPNLSLGEVSYLFKRVQRRYNLKGRAFIMRVDDQVFYISKFKNDFTVYSLGEDNEHGGSGHLSNLDGGDGSLPG